MMAQASVREWGGWEEGGCLFVCEELSFLVNICFSLLFTGLFYHLTVY